MEYKYTITRKDEVEIKSNYIEYLNNGIWISNYLIGFSDRHLKSKMFIPWHNLRSIVEQQ